MKPRDKKLAVLRTLSLEASPVSLPELLSKLTPEFKERTVRRWLNELVQEGVVKKTGIKRATKYSAIKKNGELTEAASSCFGTESLNAIQYIQKPLYERQPTSYNHDWFDAYEPNVSFYLSAKVRKALHRSGSRATNADPAGTYAHKIFNRLLIDLSYNSSRLEGNTYSLSDTERLVLSGASAEGKLDEEKVMILNHKEAIRYLVENASKLTISEQTIYTIHYLLSDGLVEAQHSGKIRDHWVRITGSTYIPYEDPHHLQLQLESIVNKASRITDPFEQSFFLLVNISYLQPFTDVNKRTARLCANIPLIIGNLVPLSFNDIEREDYTISILAMYELQDTRPIVDLYVYSYMRTCAAYDSTVKAIGFDEIRVRYRQNRRAIIRAIICDKLIGSEMETYIKKETKKGIPVKDQEAFMEDVFEDLNQIDQNNIAGLGISIDQLELWLQGFRID